MKNVKIIDDAISKGYQDWIEDVIRAGMFVRNQNEQKHQKHIDDPGKHTVMLYYVTDSDGPTQIYNGKEKLDVEPKKGRAVIFPGEYYHNSSSPKNHKNRIVVNYNFI